MEYDFNNAEEVGEMQQPPKQLDGADVLWWVMSERGFNVLTGSDPAVMISAMAVARYADSGPYYLFKCDADWEVQQDWDCDSVEDARRVAASHVHEPLHWQTWADA